MSDETEVETPEVDSEEEDWAPIKVFSVYDKEGAVTKTFTMRAPTVKEVEIALAQPNTAAQKRKLLSLISDLPMSAFDTMPSYVVMEAFEYSQSFTSTRLRKFYANKR